MLNRHENREDKSTNTSHPMLFRPFPHRFELAIVCAFDCSALAYEVRLATR